MDVISKEELITYLSLVQEATREYHNLFHSKRRERTTGKDKFQDQHSLLKAYTAVIEQSVNKALNQVDFKSRRIGNDIISRGGSSVKSNVTCHKCGKKIHINKYCRSKVNGSSGNPPKNSANDLQWWVTNKPVISYTKNIATATMNCNNKKYKYCTSFNTGNGSWGFHWKDSHNEWKNKQVKKSSIYFFQSLYQCNNLLLLPNEQQ